MARPFDDQISSQYTSSMSSQTSLAANRAWPTAGEPAYPAWTIYGEDGNIWKYKSNSKGSKANSGSRLAKIKSSPSNGALAAARKSAGHGRLHKRGMSASATQSPTTPTFDANQRFPDLTTPPSVHADQDSVSSPKSGVKGRVKIRPLLRKLSSSDANSINLSRSAAENEGLGIMSPSDFAGEGRTHGEILSGKRGFHHRSNSQVSTITSSSSHHHGAQYVHPFRQTPRPYTPPLASSYQPSLDNELTTLTGPASALSDAPDLGTHYDHSTNPTSYAPLPSSRPIPPPLHFRAHSSSRLTSSSQTNLSGTPSSLRQQKDIKPPDTMLPSGRSSLDTIFRKQRSRSNTLTNPETEAAKQAHQAAAIALLRQEWNDREEVKALKYQEAEARAQAKELAKKQKREASETRKSEAKERKRAQSNAASEKTTPMGAYGATQSFTLPPNIEHVQPRRRAATGASAGKGFLKRWELFWFKVKTAWLKLKRKMSKQ